MKEQELFFKNLMEIRNYWIRVASENSDKKTNKELLEETVDGVVHSILVMFDGGDKLKDSFSLDLINSEKKESLKDGKALHEEYFSYLENNK